MADESSPRDDNQTIFDELSTKLSDRFGEACQQCGIETAIAIAASPQGDRPIIFIRGHEYDAAVLGNQVLKQMIRDLLVGLDPNPFQTDDRT